MISLARRSSFTLFTIVILLAAACGSRDESVPAGSTDGEPPWDISLSSMLLPAGPGTAEPQLTSSAAGVILSWLEHDGKTSTLKFAERLDGVWSDARTVAAGSDWFVSWADVPSVLRMSDGTLVANWYPATDPLIEAYDMRLSYSRDGAKTWARPFSPHHDGTKTQHGFASMFEMPAGGLGLVWLDGRDQELSKDDPEGGAMALYFASFDANWKQSAETAVNVRVCECCPTAAVVTSDGVVTAFRDRSPREIRDIHVSRLENGAWTPARPLHVDNWEIDACPVNGPMLSARGRQVAAAWFTLKDNTGQAFAAFSSDAGRTWGEPIRLDDEASLGHVDIELLEDGSAAATWVEFAKQRSRFMVRRVEPSGQRSGAIDVTGNAPGRISGYPRVARHGDELVFAWTESAAGEGENGQQVKGAIARLSRATAP